MGCKQSIQGKPIEQVTFEPPLPIIELIKTKRMLYKEKIRQIYQEEYKKQTAHNSS